MSKLNIDNFKKWIQNQGGEILPCTNEYEELRFRGSQVGVLYKSGKTSNPYTTKTITCFRKKIIWSGKPVNIGRKTTYRKQKIKILERDGDKCFFCGESLGVDITVEHLIALSSGGTNSLSNMVLAHKRCNSMASNKPLNEKVELAIKMRS